MERRNYASRLNLKFNDVKAITEFAENLCNLVFVEQLWCHLPKIESFGVNQDVTELSNDPNGLFLSRFNEGYYTEPDPYEYDYYGIKGYPLYDLLPEFTQFKELLEGAGLKLIVDSPILLVTNKKVHVHRDGVFPEPPGYQSRRCAINYMLIDKSEYKTASWDADNYEPDDDTFKESFKKDYFKGLEHNTPSTSWTYDENTMNMINTYHPHGSWIDPDVKESDKYAPRVLITTGVYGTYEDARDKLDKYVDIDW